MELGLGFSAGRKERRRGGGGKREGEARTARTEQVVTQGRAYGEGKGERGMDALGV